MVLPRSLEGIGHLRTIKMRKRNFAEESSTVAEGFCAHLEEAYGPTEVYYACEDQST